MLLRQSAVPHYRHMEREGVSSAKAEKNKHPSVTAPLYLHLLSGQVCSSSATGRYCTSAGSPGCSAQSPNGFHQLWFEEGGALSTCCCNICLHGCIPGKSEQSCRDLEKITQATSDINGRNDDGVETMTSGWCFTGGGVCVNDRTCHCV